MNEQDHLEYSNLVNYLGVLNADHDFNLMLGVRDSSWVIPREELLSEYTCDVELRDGSNKVYTGKFTDSDAYKVQISLTQLIKEARIALDNYIKKNL